MDCLVSERFVWLHQVPVDSGRDLSQEHADGGTVSSRGWLGAQGRRLFGVEVLFSRLDGDHRGKPVSGWEVGLHTGMPLHGRSG